MVKKVIILDVRTKKEYCKGHVCKSILIETPVPLYPYKELNQLHYKLKKNTDKHKKNTTIFFMFISKKGIRASYTVNILKSLGFESYNLGGIDKPTDLLEKYIKHGLCICKHINNDI